MKAIGLAAERYQIMKEKQKRAQEECERNPNLESLNEEGMANAKLRAFQLELEYKGIWKEVEKEWKNRYESN